MEYALFLAAMSMLVLSGVAILGDQFRPQMIAWRDSIRVDETVTSSTATVKEDGDSEGPKTYRVFKLPKGLQNDN
ncbi:MAG: hypothetical protein AAFW47_06800 [Pseudomonadota bacterium]